MKQQSDNGSVFIVANFSTAKGIYQRHAWPNNGVHLYGFAILLGNSGLYYCSISWQLVDSSDWFYIFGIPGGLNSAQNQINKYNQAGNGPWPVGAIGEWYNAFARQSTFAKVSNSNISNWLQTH